MMGAGEFMSQMNNLNNRLENGNEPRFDSPEELVEEAVAAGLGLSEIIEELESEFFPGDRITAAEEAERLMFSEPQEESRQNRSERIERRPASEMSFREMLTFAKDLSSEISKLDNADRKRVLHPFEQFFEVYEKPSETLKDFKEFKKNVPVGNHSLNSNNWKEKRNGNHTSIESRKVDMRDILAESDPFEFVPPNIAPPPDPIAALEEAELSMLREQAEFNKTIKDPRNRRQMQQSNFDTGGIELGQLPEERVRQATID